MRFVLQQLIDQAALGLQLQFHLLRGALVRFEYM